MTPTMRMKRMIESIGWLLLAQKGVDVHHHNVPKPQRVASSDQNLQTG
jgi:hypothetical protein